MSVCFQLIDKATGATANLHDIDERLARFLGIPVDDHKWVDNWYNTIGFSLACGRSWDEIRDIWPKRQEQIDWFEKNYNVNAWRD